MAETITESTAVFKSLSPRRRPDALLDETGTLGVMPRCFLGTRPMGKAQETDRRVAKSP